MKISRHYQGGKRHQRQRGMAVVIVITLLSIIFLYVMFNARTLYYLKRDLRLVEQRQTNRWQSGLSIPGERKAKVAPVREAPGSGREGKEKKKDL